MEVIQHHIIIKAPAKTIYRLIATKTGIRKWLTKDNGWKITGKGNIGDSLFFYFGGNHHEMKILKLTPDKEVNWICPFGPPEWINTVVSFKIETKDGISILSFEHKGWAEKSAFFKLCNEVWKSSIADIKNVAEAMLNEGFRKSLNLL